MLEVKVKVQGRGQMLGTCLYNSFPPAAERVDIGTLAFKAKYSKKSHETQINPTYS